jgi:hypothetical protein
MGWLGYFSLLVRVSLYSHVYVLIVVYEGIVCTVLDTLVLTEVLANVCRWANFVGGLPKEDFDYVVDLLFDPRKGLGMNIVRYNIGGGADLTFDTNLRPFGDVPGFKSGPNEPYDWTADKRQRAVLFAARDKGANVFEAFNNSPPHWMTLSGSVTGKKREFV